MIRLPRTRIRLAITVMLMITSTTYSQHLGSARAIGTGANTAMSGDIHAIDWNPAGLIKLKDWDLETTVAFPMNDDSRSLSFHSSSIGKRFMTDHAAAFRISPGLILEFVVPSTFKFEDSTTSFVTNFDRKISYAEKYALGYAFRVTDEVSVGLSAHYLEERVSDTKYSIDTNSIIHSSVFDYAGNAWIVDWGILWQVNNRWRLGVVAKNLFRITESQIAEEAHHFSFNAPKILRFGAEYGGITNTVLGIDGDTERQFRFGGEWNGLGNVQLLAGIYIDGSSPIKGQAMAVGISTTYQLLQLDLSYLKFFSQANRSGTADINAFQNSSISNIEFNEFTSDRLTLSAKIHFGRQRESSARIEYVEMLSDVFPASQSVYAFRPIGRARVRNTAPQAIQAKVSFYVSRYMDAPTESKPFTIAPGDVLEIPFYAVFNEAVQSVSSLLIRDGDVYVNASPMEDYDDRYQTRLLIHGKNDWNGDVTLLKYFVTPDDPDVLKSTRTTVFQYKSQLDSTAAELQQFEKARIVFNEFAKQLLYVNDPKTSQDFVQYPSETINLHGGDCDDMSVCYSAMLASMGIATAFVDIVPPDHPENSHVFILFDTGISPSRAFQLTDNPKRYIIRKNSKGIETIWIPVETTVITKGFESAWNDGATEYYTDVDVKLGLLNGWVRIIDFEITN